MFTHIYVYALRDSVDKKVGAVPLQGPVGMFYCFICLLVWD